MELLLRVLRIFFSNVLWGHIVRQIPSIYGVLGYSTATLTVLFFVTWAILYLLIRPGAGYAVSVLVTILIVARPMLFPQFTINAGLLTAVAVVGWRAYERRRDWVSLLIACSSAYFGFPIRSQEFFLVLIVAAPLLPWRFLYTSCRFRVAILFLSACIVLSSAVDYGSYQTSDWDDFRALNLVRSAYTDFGATAALSQRSDILSRFNYSENDLALVGSWFFVDQKIANPQVLSDMLAFIGPASWLAENASAPLAAVRTLLRPELMPVLVTALAALVILTHRRAPLFVWLIFILALSAMAIAGRPGIVRVYASVISLLLLAPYTITVSGRRSWLATILLAANVINFNQLLPETRLSDRLIGQALRDIRVLEKGSYYVAWGANLPFEYAFPVLSRQQNDVHRLLLYGLRVFTLAPFSVARAEDRAGNGLTIRLRSVDGVPVIASRQQVEMLDRYCNQHFGSNIRVLLTHETQSFSVATVTCGARG